MLKLSCKFGESKWNPCWLMVLTSSTDTNYGLNEHEGSDQYGSFTIPPKIMSYKSHPASLVDLLDKLIELSCSQGWWEQTDRQTDGQTQVTTITLRPKRPRVKNTQHCQKLKFYQIQINLNINQCFPKQFWCWSWRNRLDYSNILFFVVHGKSPQGITQLYTSLSQPPSHALQNWAHLASIPFKRRVGETLTICS